MSTMRLATDWNLPIGFRTAFGSARERCRPRAGGASRRESSPRMQPRSHSMEHSKTCTPASLAPEPVPDRNPALLEDDLRHRRRAQAHLLEIALTDQSGVSRSTMNAVTPIGPSARVDRRVGHEQIRDRRVGDERFRAVQDVMIAVARTARVASRRRQSRLRLAAPHSHRSASAAEAGKVAVASAVAAILQDRNRVRPEVRVQRKQQAGIAASRTRGPP